jgi:hypothetical protein
MPPPPPPLLLPPSDALRLFSSFSSVSGLRTQSRPRGMPCVYVCVRGGGVGVGGGGRY